MGGGSATCWGYNRDGETGTTTNASNTVPISAVQLDAAAGSGVNGLSNFGGYHTCAVLTGGSVSCWGYNGFGELGNGSNANPVPIGTPVTAGLGGAATAVASGGYHTCAIVAGATSCRGANENAQLGRGVFGPALFTPAVVSGAPPPAVSIDAGGFHTCALLRRPGRREVLGTKQRGPGRPLPHELLVDSHGHDAAAPGPFLKRLGRRRGRRRRDPETPHRELVDLERADLRAADPEAPHAEPANGEGTDGDRAQRGGAERRGAYREAPRHGLGRARQRFHAVTVEDDHGAERRGAAIDQVVEVPQRFELPPWTLMKCQSPTDSSRANAAHERAIGRATG